MRYLTHCISLAVAGITLISSFSPASLSVSANTAIGLNNTSEPIKEVPLPVLEQPDVCTSDIASEIENIVNRPELKQGKWAILVQSLGGTNIYSLNPDSYMVPASNIKLLVTAAALQKYSPDSQIRSTSMSNWIEVTNQRSNNAYANVLLSYLGGSQSVQQALTGLGVDTNGYRLRDGSGLSRNNLATPRALVTTLRAMYHSRGNETFLASLPVAGVSGTLKNRLHQTAARGTVRAKTGTLRGVKALSGYIDRPGHGTLVFSIIANQPLNQPHATTIKGIDDIVMQLSQLGHCP